MRARRVLPLLAAGLLIAGCGSSSAGKASSPLLTELSYFPSGSPLVISLATDPNSPAIKQAQGLEARFPLAAFGQSALVAKLQQLGLNYQTDIRPLFGNPVAFGATTPTLSSSGRSQFLIAWVTKDAAKLQALLKKLGGAHATGSHDGATLYSTGASSTAAASGATLIFGGNSNVVTDALDRHAHGGGISTAQYTRDTARLPQNSLLQIFGDLSGVLSRPSAAKARAVPWVAAIRSYGVALNASSSGISLRYHLDTTGRSLSASQLPLSAGSAPPSLVSTAPISVGVNDPAQVVAFVESAEQETNPSGYAHFLKRQASVKAKTGVDVNSFARLLTGELVVASDTRKTVGRVAVSDGPTAARDLSKLMSTPNSLFSRGTSVRRLPGGMYAVKQRKQTINVGVVGGQLVAGTVAPNQLRAFASAPAAPVAGTQGAVAFRVALGQVLHLAIKHAPPQIAQAILSQFGDVVGWSSATPSGLDGSASIAVK